MTHLLPGPDHPPKDPQDGPRPPEPPEQPQHEDERQGAASGQAQRGGSQRGQGPVPDQTAILRTLALLPGLLAMGIIRPAVANSMRQIYHELLQAHRSAAGPAATAQLSDANVLEAMRANPELLRFLEPFLTDAQIDLVMRTAQQEPHGEG